MRNLKVHSGNTSDFLDEIVASKRNSSENPNYKDRIDILVPAIKLLYEDYEIAHNANNHISLTPDGYANQDKSDLLKLYTSGNSRLVKLKNSITTVLDNRAMNTCQYCTITPIGSLDHIIPKDEFPEFSVNPKNLLPACTTCNSHKSENWKGNNKTLFLNLYTDILPSDQYLFVDIVVLDDNILSTFELRNTNHINVDFFELLISHYTRLHLPQRFKQESHKIISELTNLITAIKSRLPRNEVTELVKDKIEDDKALFGNNYYKSILEEALINKPDYLNLIFE
ncbi:HNH endonuclease [Tenacibaculum ovolyticum]|uniref:HNH endonuclease n=1 Tax=Tenacibaculum ovolyticum TaxID=104270 RepID=UPI0003FACF14|nr:HNH endonuclease signature motif containing protein [Tenacibaculum ovolyticum]